MRFIVGLVTVVELVSYLPADPPARPANKAAVALALAATADTGRVARVADALADGCECGKARALPWAQAREKALKENTVLVGFFGGAEPRCCRDAVPGTLADVPAGYNPARPVVVFAPVGGGRLQVVAELPRDATAAQTRAAVAEAKKACPPRKD